ncbi:MAG: AI-2E family transporter [Clostridia bacterium]|nr:AI-2E family transporter [Clostridia bacterium]
MKINWNKKYTTYAIYAAIVSAAVIFCIFLGVYIKYVWAGILKVFEVLAPLIYGIIIAYILTPIANLFEKKILIRIRHGIIRRLLSVSLTYIVFLTAFSLLIYAVVPQIGKSFTDLQANLAVYSQSLQEWMNNISQQSKLLGALVAWLNSVFDFSVLSAPLSKIIEVIYGLVTEFSPYIMGFFGSLVVQLKNIIIGLVFAGYLLFSKELVLAQINKVLHVFFKEERIKKLRSGVKYADKTFGKYLMGMFLDAIMVGILTAVAMLIFDIPYVPLISVLIACTNIIPIFGPFIGGIPSVLIIFIADPLKALWFLIIIVVIQQIDGNLIAPRILGSSTGLPAIYVLIAITVMGGLFGLAGMVIAVPVFAILGRYINDKTEARLNAKKAAETENGADSIRQSHSIEDLDYYYDERPYGEGEQSENVALSERFGEDIEQEDTSDSNSEVDGK